MLLLLLSLDNFLLDNLLLLLDVMVAFGLVVGVVGIVVGGVVGVVGEVVVGVVVVVPLFLTFLFF